MKILGLAQCNKAMESFLFPAANMTYPTHKIISTTPINQGRTVNESFGYIKPLTEIFAPLFEKLSHLFG